MSSRHLVLIGLGTLTAAVLGTVACGDDSSDSGTPSTGGSAAIGGSAGAMGVAGSGGKGTGGHSSAGGDGSAGEGGDGSGSGGVPEVHAKPPEAGPTKASDGVETITFAISKLLVGDTDRDGTVDKTNGWKAFGYDIDGKISTATSTGLCKPRNAASPDAVYPDGNDGIDNAYGKSILPILLGVDDAYSQHINDAINAGTFTTLFAVDKLGASDDYNPLIVRAYVGAERASAPLFDGSDVWPVDKSSLIDPTDLKTAKSLFDASYLVDNTLVTLPLGDLVIPGKLSQSSFPLKLHHAVVTMELAADRKSATHGIISGILSAAELTADIVKAAGGIDVSLCTGATIDSIVAQIQQASDILSDGSQDPTKTCDGISIGLGFEAKVVALGDIVTVPPAADPCATP